MPTPEVLKDPNFDIFAEHPHPHPHPETINQIESYYVTTRKPAITGADFYQGAPDGQVHFGRALLQIGTPEQNILEYLQSVTQANNDAFVWTLQAAPQIASALRPDNLINTECIAPDAEVLGFITAMNTSLQNFSS